MALGTTYLRLIGFLIGLGITSTNAQVKLLETSQVAREFDQQSWKHEHGLPADRVWAICQTRDGFLWVATQKGLARFDGRKFLVFDHVNTPELANDDCRALVEDAAGNLWIGTTDTLVCKTGERFIRLDGWPRLGAIDRASLCARIAGGVWLGGTGYLRQFDSDQIKTFPLDGSISNPPNSVTALQEDNNVVWVGSSSGLFQFDGVSKRAEPAPPNPDWAGLEVVSFWRSGTGELWVLYSDRAPFLHWPSAQLHLACLKDGRWVAGIAERTGGLLADTRSRFLVGDASGALWLPANENLIHRYSKGELQALPLPRSDAKVFALCAFSDREGNLWIGTESHGLQRWTPRRIRCVTSQDGLTNDNVWSICQARDGSVLAGTDGGLHRFVNGRFIPLVRPDGSAIQEVRSVAEDVAGTMWVGTIRSLECIRNGEVTPAGLPGEWVESKIRALCPTRDGSVWIGTVRGLTRSQGSSRIKYTRADGLGSDEIRAVLEDGAGDLWVGTLGGGLSRWHAGRFTTLTTTNGLPSNNVWALSEGAGGVLWIGTETGLGRLQNGQLSAFGREQGLPAVRINCLVEDNAGRLWIGHDNGIYWIDTHQLELVASRQQIAVQAVQYDESDGLLSVETNGQKSNPTACKTRDGRLWFPTTRGIAVIDPSTVTLDRIAPRSAIEEIRANGRLAFENGMARMVNSSSSPQHAAPPSPLQFPPGQARVLEFRFTAVTFEAPEKARFKYRLLGLDDHWIDAGNHRETYFTDLRPGQYRFELIACNHHGVWEQEPKMVAFQVAPFFYQAWWFYLAAGSTAAGVVGLLVAWRVREIRRIHQLERLNALNEQRRQIARDIHDELGASLTHILQLSAETGRQATEPEQVRRRTQHIAALADEAVDQIGEIVWANNPEYDTLEDLVAYLREYAANFFAEANFQVEFNFPEAVPPQPVSGLFRRHLVLLVKEALQNISKHSRATLVKITLSLESNRLQLCISDDGQGLPAGPRQAAGNGLTNMRLRATELKGELELRSIPGQGTEVRLAVPILEV